MNKSLSLIIVGFLLHFTGCSIFEKKYDLSPIKPENGIYDGVGVMAPDQYGTLKTEIQNLEKNLGPQLAIVIIESLDGSDFNETSAALAKKLNLGRKEYEDGVLVLMSIKDKKISIEVGRGLEKILDIETRNRIIKEKMTYRFELREYFQCLYIAVIEINQLIEEKKDLVGKFP